MIRARSVAQEHGKAVLWKNQSLITSWGVQLASSQFVKTREFWKLQLCYCFHELKSNTNHKDGRNTQEMYTVARQRLIHFWGEDKNQEKTKHRFWIQILSFYSGGEDSFTGHNRQAQLQDIATKLTGQEQVLLCNVLCISNSKHLKTNLVISIWPEETSKTPVLSHYILTSLFLGGSSVYE